jgi:biopolymer transport protein ExbB
MVILLLAVSISAGDAHAWWDTKWKYRKKVVLDTTAQGADIKEGRTDFPILVRLHSGNFIFENANTDGSVKRFVSGDDKTLLKSHVVRMSERRHGVPVGQTS